MRITRIDFFVVSLPFVEPIRKYMPTFHVDNPDYIIKMHTDEGIVGIGETNRFNAPTVHDLIPTWIGKDPLAVNIAEVDWPFNHALYDIVGKALNVPAYRLMGGKYRDRIPVSYWSPPMPAAETAAESEAAAKRGFTSHKLKARSWNIVETADLIGRAAGSQMGIVADPNTQFGSVATAARLAQQLEPYNVVCFEDPISRDDWVQWRLLRQRTDMPLAPHLGRPADVLGALKAEAADLFNIGGNFANSSRCAQLAESAGLPVWLQVSGLCTGVAAAYAAHAGAAIRNATLPGDTLHFLKVDDLLVDSPIDPVDGHIPVPEGPGLGVVLDEKAIERYRIE